MARRTLIINGVLIVGIVVIAVVSYLWLRSPSKATAASQTTTVTQGDISETVSASGNVSSAVNIGVSFNGCSGTLTSIDVKAGQTVKTGQALATLTTSNAESALATAKTSLAQAQASLADTVQSDQQSLSSAESSRDLDIDQADASVLSAQQTDNADLAATKPAASAQTLQKDAAAVSSAKLQRTSTEDKDNQQVDQAETKLSQDQASTSQGQVAVATAQTNVTTAQSDLAACTLTSPMAGTVITVNGTVGATPGSGSVAGSSSSSSSSSSGSGSSSSSTGSTGSSSSSSSSSTSGVSTTSGFITMSDMSQLVLPSTVTEADIGGVQVGQSVSVLFAALTDANDPNGTTVNGTVSAVDLNSTVSSGVVSYGITITLVSPPSDLRLGQSGTATITTASKQNVLRVASNAVTTTGRLKSVTVQQGGATQVVTVTTGLTGNGETEIDSGLTAGETVVLPSTTSTSTLNLLGGGGGGTLLGGGR